MAFPSFLSLADGKFLYGITWNKDGQFLNIPKEETKETLPYGDIATGYNPARLRMF
jgi:hypothetical protein